MKDNNIAVSAAITGHRVVPESFDVGKLAEVLLDITKRGYRFFYVGMALGFDMLCFDILEKIRETQPIKIVACVPCRNQADGWTEAQKKEYRRALSSADECVVLGDEYTTGCMHRRNRYMVDRASLVIAYVIKRTGGAYSTVKYAVQQEKEIIYIK